MKLKGANPSFVVVVTGCLVALALWHVGVWIWQSHGWVSVLFLVGLWFLINIAYLFKHWLDGRKGLDQWPEAHGRYYKQWLELPEDAADYYDWLAQKMGNREPWRTWARMDRSIRSKGTS